MRNKKIQIFEMCLVYKRLLSSAVRALTIGLFVVKSVYASDYDLQKFERSFSFEKLPYGLKQDYFQEKQRYEDALKELGRQRFNLKTQFETSLRDLSIANEQRAKMVGYFSDHIRQPTNAIAVNDLFVANQLQKLADEKDSIFLAIGSPYLNYDSSNNAIAKTDLKNMLESLKQREVFVVYDADSTASKYIEYYIPPTSRLGISGAIEEMSINRGTILVIENPYLRLKTFLSFKHTVLSPDSLLSAGLLIAGLKLDEYEIRYLRQFYVLNSVAMKIGLSQWTEQLEEKSQVEIEVEKLMYKASAPGDSKDPWYFGSHSQPGARKEDKKWFSLLKRKKKPTPPKVSIHHGLSQATEQPDTLAPSEEKTEDRDATAKADKDQDRVETWAKLAFNSSEPKVKVRQLTEFRNLGIDYCNPENVLVTSAESLVSKLPFPARKKVPEINIASIYIDHALTLLKKAEIRSLISQSEEYASKSSRLNFHHRPKSSQPSRAVFFGSGKGCSQFEYLVGGCVREVAKKGLSITTGGEGGFMALANKVARSERVTSTGIILDKFGYRHHDDQDNISVSSYEHRIPLLLQDNDLVMVGPGGTGTMKEVATYFTKMAAQKEYTPLALISAEYFSGFFQWLENLNLPKEFVNQVYLVGSIEAMKTFMSN